MTRTLSWRPDRYRIPNCDDCGIMPAVVNGRCVRCDHTHWQAQKEAERIAAEQQDAAGLAGLAGILQAEYRDALETERDLLSGLHW